MDLCERVSMFDGFAPPYTLEQWVNYSPHPTGGTLMFTFVTARNGFVGTVVNVLLQFNRLSHPNMNFGLKAILNLHA